MNNNTSSPNPSFYDTYKDAGFCPELVLFGALRFILAIVSIAFNLVLLAVTIRSKHLRSRCNILIGFDAVCSIVTFSTNIPPFFFLVVSTGTNFIPIRICFWVQFGPAIGINLLLGAMLSVGVDRLFSVITPVWISTVNQKFYLTILICACFAYALYAISLLFSVNLLQNPNRMVPCSLGDLYIGNVGKTLFYNAMLFTGLTVLCYLAIWVIFKIRKFSHTDAKPEVDYTRRLFVSLASIVSLVSVGYFLNALFLLLLPTFNMPNIQIVFLSYALHLITDLTGAINAPLLYLLSTDYRKAFDELFGRPMFLWQGNGSQSAPGNGHVPMNIVRAMPNNNLTRIMSPNLNNHTFTNVLMHNNS